MSDGPGDWGGKTSRTRPGCKQTRGRNSGFAADAASVTAALAGWRGRGVLALRPFGGAVGMQGQRMQALLEGRFERVLRQPMALDEHLPVEALADHHHAKVALDAVAGVLRRLVGDLEIARFERVPQGLLDPLCACRHGVGPLGAKGCFREGRRASGATLAGRVARDQGEQDGIGYGQACAYSSRTPSKGRMASATVGRPIR